MIINFPEFKERPEQTLVAYCDESCQTKEKFFVVGATYFIPKDPTKTEEVIMESEKQLEYIKSKHSLHKELKWESLPSSTGKYYDGYKAFLEPFLNHPHWYFRCMVIDTSKYPLNHKQIMAGNSVTGYYKFLCVFLADSLMRNKPDYFFDIRMDEYAVEGDNDPDVLAQMCQIRFERKNATREPLFLKRCQIEQVESKKHNLLQLTDILVGAVSYVWNGKIKSESKRGVLRKELVDYIETIKKVNLGKSTHADIGRFNIWEFKANKIVSR